MYKLQWLLIISFCTLLTTAFTFAPVPHIAIEAQINGNSTNNLPNNPDDFFKELMAFMSKTKNNLAIAATEELLANWENSNISEEQLNQIMTTCQEMKAKRMRISPHFMSYITGINTLVSSGRLADKFDAWQEIVFDLAKKANKGKFSKFKKFTEFSNNFFQNEVLLKTKGKRWHIQTTDYNFEYVNDTPRIKFEEGSLWGHIHKDSLSVTNTAGVYYPLEKIWRGEFGTVTWERVGLDPNTVYAEIGEYTVDLTRNEYSVEDVIFYHKEYFARRPLKGSLTDKLAAPVEGDFFYPQFTSYEYDIRLNKLAPNVKFVGGFGLNGSRILGFGNDTLRAKADFYSEDGRHILSARSKRFAVKRQSEINAKNTEIALYFANDSIYHPSLNFKYVIPNKELRLVRDTKASAQIAFMSSYHQLEANVDAIFWTTSTPVINFEMVSQLKTLPVFFESFNLYEPKRLSKYRKVTDIDPVAKLHEFTSNGERKQVSADKFAKFLNPKFSIESILSSIFEMVKDGFIYYNVDTDMITVREKVKHYMESRSGKKDFDRIAIVSQTKQENAQLNIEEKELIIAGVKKIELSDSQNVVLHPNKGALRLFKNRDMEWDGGLVAGNVDFGGKDFKFHYDKFNIELDSIAQMQIYLPDEKGEDPIQKNSDIRSIKTVIRDVSGILTIDEADNKSGRESKPEYPIFESNGPSYIYYNSKKVYNGAYKKDTFFFKLQPFVFDNLDHITPEMLQFPGTMVTGNIFPKLTQTITLQNDYSLGFSDVEAKDMDTYGVGKFTGSVSMSNKGLHGDGKLEHMAAVFAQKFIFLPDSMMAAADSFHISRGILNGAPFPEAYNGAVNVKWIPATDSMVVNMKQRPFTMFGDLASFKGNLLVTSKGLRGTGTVNWEDASIRAGEFDFNENTFFSDSADVIIKNEDAARVSFNSYNVRARVNMDEMLGEFKANGENIPIVLPYNMYKTTASEFYWLMNDKLVNIRVPDDDTNNYFESTHPDQGGLKFRASGGVVNLSENTVQIDGIPYIAVADAKIRPSNTKLTIMPNAELQTLENALLVCDTLNEFHSISKATITITNINQFEGSGEYKYKGKKLRKQKIYFDMLGTKEDENQKGNWYTFGAATIPEDRKFKLNKKITFKGDAVLDSRKQFLVFDGFAKMKLQTERIQAEWFKFKDEINPNDIKMDLSVPIGERTDTLVFGISQDMDALDLYPSFLTSHHTPLDEDIFEVAGGLEYDADKNTYTIIDKEILKDKTVKGNTLSLNDDEQTMTAQGKFNFAEKFGLVDVDLVGTALCTIPTNEYQFRDMLLGLRFHFDKKLWENLEETVKKSQEESGDIDYTTEVFEKNALQLVADKQVDKFKEMLATYSYLPEKVKGLDHDLLITDLNMVWDTSARTLRSTGQFGLSYAGEKYVNRMINGYIEIGVRRTGNFFTVYLETDKDEVGEHSWYYFEYRGGAMSVLSSDPKFNQSLAKAKEAKRKKEDKKRNLVYIYKIAPLAKRNNFVFRMKEAEFGPQTPLPMPNDSTMMNMPPQGDFLPDQMPPPQPQDGFKNNPLPPLPQGDMSPEQMPAPSQDGFQINEMPPNETPPQEEPLPPAPPQDLPPEDGDGRH